MKNLRILMLKIVIFRRVPVDFLDFKICLVSEIFFIRHQFFHYFSAWECLEKLRGATRNLYKAKQKNSDFAVNDDFSEPNFRFWTAPQTIKYQRSEAFVLHVHP